MRVFVILVVALLILPAVLGYDDGLPVKIIDKYFYEHSPKVIEDKEISNDEGDCVRVIGSEWLVIKNNVIHDCVAQGRKRNGYAIYVEKVDNLIIETNNISNSSKGIHLKNVQNVVIRTNNINSISEGPAITIQDTKGIRIYNNLIEAVEAGIDIELSEDIEINYNNMVKVNNGIKLRGATPEKSKTKTLNLTITDNSIELNSGRGIQVEAISQGLLLNNVISGATEGIVLAHGTSKTEVKNNNILDALNCSILIINSPENLIFSNILEGSGICLDGKNKISDYYEFFGNRNNRIHLNIFRAVFEPVIPLSGFNDGTEIFYNNFDFEKTELVFNSPKGTAGEISFNDNTYKQESLNIIETASEESNKKIIEDAPQPPEQLTTETDNHVENYANPLVIYSFLTLLFVILTILSVIFLLKRKPRRPKH